MYSYVIKSWNLHIRIARKRYIIVREILFMHICDTVMYGTLHSVKKNKGYEKSDVYKIIMSHFSVTTLL